MNRVCVAYDGMERFFPKEKLMHTGNPVRKSIVEKADRATALIAFDLDPDKKVVLATVAFFVGVAEHNAWQLYRLSPAYRRRKLDHLAFRRVLVEEYLKRYRNLTVMEPIVMPSPQSRVTDEVRTDGLDHYQGPLAKRRRCAYCHKTCGKECKKCGVPLHDHCVKGFHRSQT